MRQSSKIGSAIARSLSWVDNRKSVDKFFWILVAGGMALALLDLFYKKKTYFTVEYVFAFYALYGFFMCAALVVAAKGMRLLLMRDESYYAPQDVETEPHPEFDLDRKQADE